MSAISKYGYCPLCYQESISRERGLNGNDNCRNGHIYPSKDAIQVIGKWISELGFVDCDYIEITDSAVYKITENKKTELHFQDNIIQLIRLKYWIPYKVKDDLIMAAKSILEGLDDSIPGCTNWMVLGKNAKILAEHYLRAKGII